MNFERIIDDYITRETKATIIGYCEECGDLIEDAQQYQKIGGKLFCNEECTHAYYEVEYFDNVIYCDCCDMGVGETYIKDVYGNIFCNIKCLTEYYDG